MMNLAELRIEFMRAGLSEAEVSPNPISQCQKWLADAIAAKFIQANAMTLATVDHETLQPSARIVLLKDLNEQGFFFYTNSLSQKGREIHQSPKVSLLFYWDQLERQIRIEGSAHIIDNALADQYFASRPRESNIGAWASAQSEIIENRQALESHYQELVKKFAGQPVPRPPHWRGYCVQPHKIEFWQGRPNRLHDRLCYSKHNDRWQINRLAP